MILTSIALVPLFLGSGDPLVEDVRVHGRYVEARTATVFAGACHYGAEYTLAGRDAVVGFEFAGGRQDGVELAGLDLVAVVGSDRNLAAEGAERRSVLWLPAHADEAERHALEAWARERMGAVLGEVTEVVTAPVDVRFEGEDGFALAAGDGALLRGHGLPDRECCTMPFKRWYAPLVALEGERVGFAEELSLAVPSLGTRVRRTEDNCAFLGRF